jgi:hypothetical protein
MDSRIVIFLVSSFLTLILLGVINDSLVDILNELKSLNAYLQVDLKMD